MNHYCYIILVFLLLIVNFGEMAPGRRGMAKDDKNTGDHSYNKTQQNKQSDAQALGTMSNISDICNGCKKNLKKNIQCGFCDNKYCISC